MKMKQHGPALPSYVNVPLNSFASSSPLSSSLRFKWRSSSSSSQSRRSSSSSSSTSENSKQVVVVVSEYKGGMLDDLLLNLFRNKMVEEVGWDSQLPGYDGLIQVANRLLINTPNYAETSNAAVRILRSLFPPFLPHLFKLLIAPLAQGHLAAIMVARVTALSCQWLMGPCKINSIQLPNGHSSHTGVFVERCKYLEASKCVGICINTCKLPTQTFIKDYMGVPLVMEPNFSDYSCQFKFGVDPPIPAEDKSLSESCLEICPNANRRRELSPSMVGKMQCPKL